MIEWKPEPISADQAQALSDLLCQVLCRIRANNFPDQAIQQLECDSRMADLVHNIPKAILTHRFAIEWERCRFESFAHDFPEYGESWLRQFDEMFNKTGESPTQKCTLSRAAVASHEV
jgi:hypothetical protein